MSKKETWRTRLCWQIVGGILIEEFHAIKFDSAAGIARRLIDGVIIVGEETRIRVGGTQDIEGKDVVAIQTKGNQALYMGLGTALFSRDLLKRYNRDQFNP